MNAIKTVNAIKQKRENLFVTKRLKKGVELRKKEDVKLVETQMHLIKAPNGKATLYKLIKLQRENPIQLKKRIKMSSKWMWKWKICKPK